ncbi:hypothetical protein [Streptomyces sp. NL15-2K]|uniref:hypothetical protein n=1 Tax=Streptomyces sp. NL15-2K TaxID=376149 RepID=UPI00155B22AA|nr:MULTISPECIES: hypothetical protein [Actinomycetes]WKX13076.1 hypothetical protein Q4V64_38345 [Kutzneria buriramensis]
MALEVRLAEDPEVSAPEEAFERVRRMIGHVDGTDLGVGPLPLELVRVLVLLLVAH